MFGIQIMPSSYEPIAIFIFGAGCVYRVVMLVAARRQDYESHGKKGKKVVSLRWLWKADAASGDSYHLIQTKDKGMER